MTDTGGDRFAEFEAAYASTPPWDIGEPQPAFAQLAAEGHLHGLVLDAGCGTGEHALMAAEAGCEAYGIDIAPSAIRLAREKARARGLSAEFAVGDARDLAALGRQFDAVLDCGLFHVFDDDDRASYVTSLAAALRRDGDYYLLCFSDDEPPGWGPRRITQDEIHRAFADGWHVASVEPTGLNVTIRDEPVRSWLARIVRR